MAYKKPWDFHVGDVIVYSGGADWDFVHEGDELVVGYVDPDFGTIGIKAGDHPDRSAIYDTEDYLWYYRKENFEPYPVNQEHIEFSLDSVFK